MSAFSGYVTAALQLGLQSIQVRPQRSIGGFTAQVVFEETHVDELVITDHPVETGARISDHAYMKPSEVTIRCGWSNSPTASGLVAGLLGAVTGTINGITSLFSGNSESQVQAMYKSLLDLQRSRIPFEIQTGKRIYSNMLVQSLRIVTDKENENTLAVTAVCREVLMVSVQIATVAAPAASQADPAATQSPVSKGVKSLIPAPVFNAIAGAQSFPVKALTKLVGVPL
jgi:hypothetical protein